VVPRRAFEAISARKAMKALFRHGEATNVKVLDPIAEAA